MAGLNTNVSGRIGDGTAQVFGNKTVDTANNLSEVNELRDFNKIQALEKERAETLKDINFTLEGLDKDINGELMQGKAYLQEYARKVLKEEGLNDESFAKITEAKASLQTLMSKSQGQKELLGLVNREMRTNDFKKNGDLKLTMQNQEEWRNLPINERSNFNKDLVVYKDKPFVFYDMPSQMYMPDYAKHSDTFLDMISIPGSEFNKWYQDGLDRGDWVSPETAMDKWKTVNDAKYKDRTPSMYGRRVQISEYGDPDMPSVVMDQYYRPGRSRILMGNNEVDAQSVFDISDRAKGNESYNLPYQIQGQDGWKEGTLNNVTPSRYFQTPDGRDILEGVITVKVDIPPTESQLKAARESEKYYNYSEEDLVKELTKIRSEHQYIHIDVTEDGENQKKKRPNTYGAFTSKKSQTDFEQVPVTNQADDILNFDYENDQNDSDPNEIQLNF